MSQRGDVRTDASQQIEASFDHFVGSAIESGTVTFYENFPHARSVTHQMILPPARISTINTSHE